MISPILLMWILLSVMVAATCTFSFLQPFWFVHRDNTYTFGMICYCLHDSAVIYHNSPMDVCYLYGGYFRLGNLPSGAWQAACVMYGCGSMLLCLGAVLVVCNTCVPREYDQRLASVAGYTQTVGGKFMFNIYLHLYTVYIYMYILRKYSR
jgi:hypothetical protein